MKIAVVIPCFINHIPNLLYLLESLEKQTRIPDQVVISCSSTNEPLILREYKFIVKLFVCEEKKNAAQNRNIASSNVSNDIDIISYFDADDVMHPQRLEILEYVFNKGINIVLHNFISGSEYEHSDYNTYIAYNKFIKTEEYDIIYNNLIPAPSGCATHKIYYEKMGIIHHSQVSITKNIFNIVKFREDIDSQGKEDSLFCGDILRLTYLKNAYIKNQLSIYEPSNTNYI